MKVFRYYGSGKQYLKPVDLQTMPGVYKVKASVKNADSWQICYRTEDGYEWKTKKVSGAKTSVILKGLKTGKKYEVKARSCKVKNGRNYYSRWSETKVSGKIK